jgi:hypothetical protein
VEPVAGRDRHGPVTAVSQSLDHQERHGLCVYAPRSAPGVPVATAVLDSWEVGTGLGGLKDVERCLSGDGDRKSPFLEEPDEDLDAYASAVVLDDRCNDDVKARLEVEADSFSTSGRISPTTPTTTMFGRTTTSIATRHFLV